MKSDSGSTISSWMEGEPPISGPALQEDTRVDVCVVGAGIAGLTSAYLLARAGKSVIVIDDGFVGGGETGRTTAHLSDVMDDGLQFIERHHGLEGARAARASHAAAIDRIETIVLEERIACGFERLDGYLLLAPGQDAELLEGELEAARRAGFEGVERLERSPLAGFDARACLRFLRQAQFHPLHYLAALASAIHREGGRIHGSTHAAHIEGGAAARVETSRGRKIDAGAIVVATNSPVNDRVKLQTKLASYRTYVVEASLPRGLVPRALYWDTEDPYHYVRLSQAPDGTETLIVGGEDHKTGQEEEPARRHEALERWMQLHFPMAGPVRLWWSGQVIETIDGLAFIGRNPLDHDNVYVATGDSGMGLTHGTLAGMLISDSILGLPNSWAELYDPARKTVTAVGRFLEENLNVAAQYLRDYTAKGDVESVDEVEPGTGAIVRRGLGQVAVYRDEHGALHELSAVCPHLGGIVRWNAVEKTWDCPCHGSRFDALGRVINGPAIRGLSPAARSRAG